MTADLTAPHFHDDTAARKFLENVRWPEGPVCPHCGTVGESYETKKAGRYRCGSPECRKDLGHRRQAADLWGASLAASELRGG